MIIDVVISTTHMTNVYDGYASVHSSTTGRIVGTVTRTQSGTWVAHPISDGHTVFTEPMPEHTAASRKDAVAWLSSLVV